MCKCSIDGIKFLFFLFCLAYGLPKRKTVLYDENDHVTILTKASHDAVMKDKLETNWFIEYYNSYCGHCVNFAPIFKQFAASVEEWNDTVKIGVLDCRTEFQVCENKVRYYPTLTFYRRGWTSRNGVEIKDVRTTLDLKWHLLKHLSFETFLQPHLQEEVEKKDDNVFVIRDEDGYLAKEVILDLHSKNIVVLWLAPSKSINSTGLPRSRRVHLFVVKNHRMKVVKLGVISRDIARNLILNYWRKRHDSQDSLIVKAEEESSKDLQPKAVASFDQHHNQQDDKSWPHLEDIYSSVSIALRNDVGLHTPINGEKLTALKNFINIVTKYWSYLFRKGKKVYTPVFYKIMNTFNKLETLTRNLTRISAEQWKDIMDKLPLTKTEKFVHCSGSAPFFRGYPCGLWTLFHSLTVMECLQPTNFINEDPRYVLRSVKQFIKYFFSCRECAENFEVETKHLETEVTAHCQGMLWFWRLHNKVNYRLRGQPSEDPKFPKIQFPSIKRCPLCHEEKHNDIWNDPEVKGFLIVFYNPKNLKLSHDSSFIKSITQITKNNLSHDKPYIYKQNTENTFLTDDTNNLTNQRSFDYLPCVLVSLLTTCVAFYIFIMFYKHRYRRYRTAVSMARSP